MNELDYWTVDGSPYFGTIPGGLTPITKNDAPICLRRGNLEWGAMHMEHGHGHWLKKINMSAPQLVWLKCQQTGNVYDTESIQKFTFAMSVWPNSLMVLKFIQREAVFSVTTFYYRGRLPDGQYIGTYRGIKQENQNPVFDFIVKPTPQIILKKPKRIVVPAP